MSLDVESILYGLDIEVLKERGDELIARCPQHRERTGAEDANPSWSINSKTYVHHCFSCGYSGTLNMLYQDIRGDIPEDLEWELSKQSVLSTLQRTGKEKSKSDQISEWSLHQYGDVPDRLLLRRRLTRASADFFGIRWDSVSKAWVIPIRDPNGGLMGFQFRQKGSVINHPPGMEKSSTLFGLHLFYDQSRITVVESPLDAVRFHVIGVPAVSSFGASVSGRQVELLARHFQQVVSAMDNDPPGVRATEFLRRELVRKGASVLPLDYSGLGVKDPGDVESDGHLLRAWRRSAALRLIEF